MQSGCGTFRRQNFIMVDEILLPRSSSRSRVETFAVGRSPQAWLEPW